MGLIQNLVSGWKDKKEEKKRMEQISRWEEGIEERKMSNNERALMKFQEEDRQERIKHMLKKFQNRERDEMWRGKKFNPAFAPNIVKDDKNLFKDHKLFSDKENLFTGDHGKNSFLSWK